MKKCLNISFSYDNQVFKSRIDYVLAFIENHPLAAGKIRFVKKGESGHDIQIAYGIRLPDAFHIPEQNVLFNTAVPDSGQLWSNTYSFEDQLLYAVETRKKPEDIFCKKQTFQFDLLETIFFHISRFEEWHYYDGKEDEHGRMDERQQFLVKHRLEQTPVVDQLIVCFLKALGIAFEDQKTTYRVTHDIDFIFRRNDLPGLLKSMGGAILKRQDLKAAGRVWQHRHDKNPYDTFDWMLRKATDLEKVIYFLVDGHSWYDDPYDLDLPVFKKAVRLSKERGYRIGIHPSYESWKSINMIRQERQKLENAIRQEVSCTRQHFLRFSWPHTAKIIQEAGLKEDSSLGYANRIGFRCGTGFSYHLYDFEQEKAYEFLEMPLILMDSALLAQTSHHPQEMQNIWDTFLTENRFNTKITFNFHNSRFYDAAIQGVPLSSFYESLFE